MVELLPEKATFAKQRGPGLIVGLAGRAVIVLHWLAVLWLLVVLPISWALRLAIAICGL